MKKYYIPVILALIAVPVFMLAATEDTITSNPCMVRIYHTNFPIGEGKIVTRDGQLWYARTYLPGCEDADQGFEVVSNNLFNSSNPPMTAPPTGQTGEGIVNFIVGNPCYVRVYHTNFNFPPEGGVIIQVDDQMYFVPEYLPNCHDAASTGTVIRRSDQAPVSSGSSTGGEIIDFVIGDPCLVPIYHTNFNLNGGKIITKDGRLWYVKSYLPQCSSI